MTSNAVRLMRVGAVYGLALLSLWLQFDVALSGPGDSLFSKTEYEARQYLFWGGILVLSVSILLLAFLLFKDKSRATALAAMPGVIVGLGMPAVFIAFRVRDFVDAFH